MTLLVHFSHSTTLAAVPVGSSLAASKEQKWALLAHSSPLAARAPPPPPPSFLTAVGAVRAKRPLPLAKLGCLACSWLCFAVYEALLQPNCCNEAKKKKKKTTSTTKATRRYFTILSTIKAKACRTIVAAMKGTQPPPLHAAAAEGISRWRRRWRRQQSHRQPPGKYSL